MQREVLAVRKRVLGAEHPDTLNIAHNLADSLSGQGKYDEAEKMARMGDFEADGGVVDSGVLAVRKGPIDQLKLYVGSLSWGVDDESLQAEFSEFGPCEVRRAGDDWNPVDRRL
jgi:hypothetical protein